MKKEGVWPPVCWVCGATFIPQYGTLWCCPNTLVGTPEAEYLPHTLAAQGGVSGR